MSAGPSCCEIGSDSSPVRPAKGTSGVSRDRGDCEERAYLLSSDEVVEDEEGDDSEVVAAIRCSRSARVWVSRCRSRSSSSATRSWMWSSRVLARLESVCKRRRVV